ncbi:peptidoglycan-binding domain-containing protein [Lysobacter capsici]|uniref:peptidoglycan-binding domain-containing protein n=1 Tax=Lysobacter capsici TaxID=435897 RepID=UPI0009E30DE8|nr:peptidoglycan-binding protein [Lysobacter capsici]
MPKYTIVESIDAKNTINDIHDYEDIERHHPSRGNENGRVYGTVNGEREELLGNYNGTAHVTRDNDYFVSKDLILNNGKNVPVPAVANGYIGAIDPNNGIVEIYDRPSTDPDRELIAKYRHLDLSNTQLKPDMPIEYGQPLAPQGGYNNGNPKAFGPHVHIDINTQYLPQMERYIRDMDNGTITTDTRPFRSENLTGEATVTSLSTDRRQIYPGSVGRTAPAAPMADGVLSQREKGQEVRELQERLNELGYTDASGQPLRADGNFGQKTKEAVKAFQQDHDGLTVDGIAGSKTLDALKTATAKGFAQDTPTPTQASSQPAQPAEQGTVLAQTATGPLLSDPSHPDHGLYKQALAGIEKLGPQGFKDQAERERAAATLTYEAKVSGMSKIDHVVPNASGTGLFAVQGAVNDPAHQRVYADKARAAQQPVDKTTEQLSQDASRQNNVPSQTNQDQVKSMTV